MQKSPLRPSIHLTLARRSAWVVCVGRQSAAVVCLALLLAPALPAARAADAVATATSAGRGSISGRVKNAVTGQYLSRARVTVRGTQFQTYTDDFGAYNLVDVPSGPAILDVFYTDMDPLELTLDVPSGGAIERDVDLTSNLRRGGEIVKLDSVVVLSEKETNAETLAVHEQRFAPNIMNVVSTDAMGGLIGNDAGEFLKFLPGLVAEYAEGDVGGISVRGIGGDMTAVSFDGAPIVTGANTGPTRAVDMRTQSLNNISRIEVTKVPLPSTPADALGGSINMISKSAFERSTGEFNYGLLVNGNSHALTLKKTPHAYGDKDTYKLEPGWNFEYTQPFGKNFGIVLTGMQSSKYTPQNMLTPTWNAAGTNIASSVSQPYFQQFGIRAAPRSKTLTAFSGYADWRVLPHTVLSIGGRWSRNIAARTGTLATAINVGTNGAPTPTSGVPLTFGPDFTHGATGRGTVTLSEAQQYSTFQNLGSFARVRFDNGRWRVESSFNYASSDTRLNPQSAEPGGFFPNASATLAVPVRINLDGIGPDGPAQIQAFDNNNQPVDLYDIRNYRMSTAGEDRRHLRNDSKHGNLDVRRRLDLFFFPTAVQVGGLHRVQSMDRYNEANGNWTPAAANSNPAPYVYQDYVRQEDYATWPFPAVDPSRVWRAFAADRSLFTQTTAQMVAAENSRLNTSQYAREAVTAAYVQGEARLFRNRLQVVTGVRFERTEVRGEGMLYDPNAVYVRNADGSFAHDAKGNRIRTPDAGAAGSLQEVAVMRKERAYKAGNTYSGYYPSLHLTYNITDNLLARLAYARTYGRPNFPDIIPSATINEADLGNGDSTDPNIIKGDITVTNTGLKPWTANNWDLSLEYYTQSGGVFSAGAFMKDITNFFGDGVIVATEADLAPLGLDSRYVGWNIHTQFNSGDARITGAEFNVRQSLRALGMWGRYFTVFANGTLLRLEGNPYASFSSFVPRTANWGVSFNYKRLTVLPKWNYRGLNKLAAFPAFGPSAYTYIAASTLMDLSVEYRINRHAALTLDINNVFNAHRIRYRYGADTPAYARQFQNQEYGALFSVGIKGSF